MDNGARISNIHWSFLIFEVLAINYMKRDDTLQEDLIQIYGLDVFGLPFDQLHCLPVNSDDLPAVESLLELDEASIGPFLPFLLIWTNEDAGKVGEAIVPVLLRHAPLLVSEIQTILSDSGDSIWCTRLIEDLVLKMDPAIRLEFVDHLEGIVEFGDKSRQPDRVKLLKTARRALQEIRAQA